jgi:pilus assembly protein CpaF
MPADNLDAAPFTQALNTLRKQLQSQITVQTTLNDHTLKRLLTDLLKSQPSIRPAWHEHLIHRLIQEVLGFGILQPLLDNPDITEIMVNGLHDIFVEYHQRLVPTSLTFDSLDTLRGLIEKMLAFSHRHVDESHPYADARLPDGSRINVVMPPISLHGPLLTIRKFPTSPWTLSQLLAQNTLSASMAQYLTAAIHGRLNILVVGGTSSGKTTTLNALAALIPAHERILTLEDAAELRLPQRHWIPLETRTENIEHQGAICMRDLLRNALRMRPERLIIGEVRGAESLDMLQAMNTGHEGGLTTIHANTPRDALARLETMVLMADLDLPLRAIRQQMASALHVIVHQMRDLQGQRRIVAITEITGMEHETILTQDLFRFHFSTQQFLSTGIVSHYRSLLQDRGITMPTPDV